MSFSDNRLVLYEPVPRLENLAAISLAINLTMNYAKHVTENKDIIIVFEYERVTNVKLFRDKQKEIYDAKPDDLIIPPGLEIMVQKHVRRCCDEIQDLIYFYDRFSSFDLKMIAVMREFLSNIVWKSNGKIDHLHTAFKLVNNAELKEEVKFHLMCEFCMEEKIRNAWQKMRNCRFVQSIQFWREPLWAYWCCVMTGDFSKIIYYDVKSVEEKLILTLSSQPAHFPAIEYIFNRLRVDDHIKVGAILMGNRCRWTRFLISKYTEDQQYQLFSNLDYVAGIFGAFARDKSYEYLDDALKIWNHIKYLVNGHQYMEILNRMEIWRIELHEELCEFFQEFWSLTPYNLKLHIFQIDENKFMPQFVQWFDYEYEDYDYEYEDYQLVQRDDRILFAILSEADLEYRRRFWRSKWVQIVNHSQPSRLKQILDLCLLADEIAAFKKDAMSSPVIKKYLTEIIKNGKILLLNEFLNMFIDGGQREIDDAKRELFNGATVSDMYRAVERCEETEENVAALNEFLLVVFAEDVKGEVKFKKQTILQWWFELDGFYRQERITKIIYVSDRICEATLLKKVKNFILKKVEILISSRKCRSCGYSIDTCYCGGFSKFVCDELLLWCLEDQQKVEEFKTSREDYFRERNKKLKWC